MTKKGIFFDRDGVINKSLILNNKPYPPKSLKDFEFFENIEKTLEQVRKSGFMSFIFTNQPDVARGALGKDKIEEINKYIYSKLPINKIYCCYHDDKDNCECRKPKAGMLYEAAKEFDVDLKKSFVVGDRWRDIDAGNLAGCKTIFIDYGYSEKLKTKPDYTINKIDEIIDLIK